MTARRLVLIAAVLGAVTTAAVALVPVVSFVYESPSLHVAIETSAVLIGLMAAVLTFGRFRQTGAIPDLLIVYVLAVLAFTNLFFSAVPNLIGARTDEVFLAWTQNTARLVATEMLAIAAFIKSTRFKAERIAGLSVVAASLITLLVIALLAIAASPLLPDPIGSVVAIEDGRRPQVDGHPVFLALQLAQMVLFAVAAFGFLKKTKVDASPMMTWIAAGSVLAAFSRFNYFLFPSRYTDYVYVGDFLRLGFYVCLLIGGMRELSSYWRRLSEAQVGETRRNLARSLHDGLAQELVFITAQTQRLLKKGADPEDLQRLAGAADRAVAESRRAINALSTGKEQTLEEALEELGEEVSRRVGVPVVLDLEPVTTSAEAREALIRMVREALMNAVRHSSAGEVRLELRDDGATLVRVKDDGVGFDPTDDLVRKKGFGLVSLTERARGLGGEAAIDSAPGRGTEVTIRVPRDGVPPAS